MPIQDLLDVERFLIKFDIRPSEYSFNYVRNVVLPYYQAIVEKEIEEKKEKEATRKNEELQRKLQGR